MTLIDEVIAAMDKPKQEIKMRHFRRTKPGVQICPFFTWTSELREGPPSENDVNLTHCIHPDNPDDCEGNCFAKACPLMQE